MSLFSAILVFQLVLAIGNIIISIMIFKKMKTRAIKVFGHLLWIVSSFNLILLSALSNN